jgi:hypothetical protein
VNTSHDDTTMPFSEFGPEFISRILTPQRIASQVQLILPKEPIPFNSKEAEGTAKPELGDVSRTEVNNGSCNVTFLVPLILRLHFKVKLAGFEEAYEGPAALTLRMLVTTYKPAILHIDVDKIAPEDIKFDAKAVDNWGLAKKLTAPWDLLNSTVRKTIAAQINKLLKGSETSRTLDLSQMAHQDAYAGQDGGEIRPATSREDKAPVLATDTVVRGTLGPGQAHLYSIVLGAGERVDFGTYVNTVQHYVTIEVGFDILSEKGKVLQSDTTDTNFYGWGGDYALKVLSFIAEETGLYTFRLKYLRAEDQSVHERKGVSVNYIVTQSRSHPDLGDPICFDEFGQQFMPNIVSATMIRKELEKQVAEPQKIDDPVPMGRAIGSASVTIGSITLVKTDGEGADRELTYKLVLKVIPDMWVTIGVGKEHWRVQTTVTVKLRIQTARPLTIQVVPEKVTEAEVSVDKAECLEGWGTFNAFGILTSNLVGKLVIKLNDKLNEAQEKSTVRIEKKVEEAMNAKPPPKEEPGTQPPALKPGEAPPLEAGKSYGQTLLRGQVPVYTPFSLEAGQTARFEVRTKLVNVFTVDNISTAILDAKKGWLTSKDVSGSKNSSTHLFSYKASSSGTYFIRVRFEHAAVAEQDTSDSVKLEYEVELLEISGDS